MDAPIHAHSAEALAFGGEKTSGFFEGQSGARLRYAFFHPKEERRRGTIVIVQGRNECIEKYLETIADLNEAGFSVATFDLRGQGLSGRLVANARFGHIDRFADYVADLDRFLSQVVEPVTEQPPHILAHSLGALVTLTLAPELAGRVGRIVLSAPLVGLTGLPVPPRLAFSVARLASFSGLGRRPLSKETSTLPFDGNPLTSCPVRYKRFADLRLAHPDLGIGPPTARWLSEIHRAMARASQPDHLTRITVPTLILAPMRDGVVPYADMERLASRFRASRLIAVPGARHELLMEQDRYRAQAMAATLAFFPDARPEPEKEPETANNSPLPLTD